MKRLLGFGIRRIVLKLVVLVGLCIALLAGLPTGQGLAQLVTKSGELARGETDSIPVELEVGEMVQGYIAVSNGMLYVSLDGPDGGRVQRFGYGTRWSFHYAAETDGLHMIVVEHRDGPADLRPYKLEHSIHPTELEPGAGSGKAPVDLWARLKLAAIVVALSIVGFFALLAFARRWRIIGEVAVALLLALIVGWLGYVAWGPVSLAFSIPTAAFFIYSALRYSARVKARRYRRAEAISYYDDEGSLELPEGLWVLPMWGDGQGMLTSAFAYKMNIETSYALRILSNWESHKNVRRMPGRGNEYKWWRRV